MAVVNVTTVTVKPVTFLSGVLVARRRSGRRVPASCHHFLRRHPRLASGEGEVTCRRS